MIMINIHELKAKLSQYLKKAQEGERVILCKRNIPVAELKPLHNAPGGRDNIFGYAKGRIATKKDAFEPLSNEENLLWSRQSKEDPLFS